MTHYAHSCPIRKKLQGLSRGMKIYDKNTIPSAVVRVLAFSIWYALFCLVVFILSMRLRTVWAGYLILMEILDKIYIYILLRSVTV